MMEDPKVNDVVRSPVTGGRARYWGGLDAATIVARYAEAKVDVSRYFVGMATASIFECVDTGYRFFHPPSLAGQSDFYEQLYDPGSGEEWIDPDHREWSEDYQYAFDRIVPGERLLDMGCGYGYFLRRADGKAEATGIDGNQFAVDHARKLGLDVHLGTVEAFQDRFAESFDTVCSFQVLEHVYDVRAFMTGLTRMVKPGGRLILAVPNNEPFIRRFDAYNTWNCPPHHIGLWNRDSLERMGREFDLRAVEHRYCEVSGRWTVEAYLRARYLLGIKQEIHQHSAWDKLRMLALAPYAVPLALVRHVVKDGRGTRNVIAMTFAKGS